MKINNVKIKRFAIANTTMFVLMLFLIASALEKYMMSGLMAIIFTMLVTTITLSIHGILYILDGNEQTSYRRQAKRDKVKESLSDPFKKIDRATVEILYSVLESEKKGE